MKKRLFLSTFLFCGYIAPVFAEYTNVTSGDYLSDAEYMSNGQAFTSIGLNKAYTGSDETAFGGFSGKDVVIAIIDGGTMPHHKELDEKFAASLYIPENNAHYSDHGTHVAGIVAAARNEMGMHGVAYGATILPFSTYMAGECEETPGCMVWSTAWTEMLKDENDEVKIINNSWELDNFSEDELKKVISVTKEFVNKDKLIIASAGNSTALHPSAFPAGIAAEDESLKNNLISVVAYDPTKMPNSDRFIAGYSNLAQGAQKWTLAAPGTMYSSIVYNPTDISAERYDTYEGTSAAAPIVSGVAALVQEAFPYMGGKQIADVLLSTAFKKEDLELSPYMIQEDNGIKRFLFFMDNTQGMTYETALSTAGIASCEGTTICHNVKFEDVFGQGLVNAGDAVKGPKYFDADRLTDSDFDSSLGQFLYSVNTGEYDSTWSNNISQKVISDEESEYFNKDVGLKKRGTGTLVLAGNNTFSGTSLVEEGTLALSGSMLGGVTVNGGSFAMIGGTIDGAVKVNSGGTLQIGYGTLNGAVTNEGTTTAVSGTATGNIINTGTFTVTGAVVNDVPIQGNFTSSGTFTNKNVFSFNADGGFTGTLNNQASVLVTGNSQFSGELDIASSGNMTVSQGASLTATGSIENNGIISGFGTINGTVNSSSQGGVATSLTIQTLNSDGNIILTSSGNEAVAMQVDTLNINGGKFVVSNENKMYETGQVYTIINFNTLTAFNNFETGTKLSDFIVVNPIQESNRIDMLVNFIRISSEDSAFSPQEQQITHILDQMYFDKGKSDFRRFYYYSKEGLKEQIGVLRSKAQPIPTEHLPLTKTMASQVYTHLFANTMMRDAANARQPYIPMQQYQGKYYRGRSGGNPAPNQKVWGQFLGGWTKEDGNSTLKQGSVNSKTIGAMFGYDYEFSEQFLIGLTAGAASASLKQDRNEVYIKDYRAGLYTGSRFGKLTLNTILMGGLQTYKSMRRLQLTGLNVKNIGRFNGYSAEFDINVGYDLMRMPYRDYSFYLRPYLAASVNYLHQDAYEEKGSDFMALGIDESDETSVSVSPGITLGYTFSDMVLTADIGYSRIVSGDSIKNTAYFLADTSKTAFSSLSSDTDKDFFNAGLGLKKSLSQNLQVHFWAGTRLSKKAESLNLSATLNYKF